MDREKHQVHGQQDHPAVEGKAKEHLQMHSAFRWRAEETPLYTRALVFTLTTRLPNANATWAGYSLAGPPSSPGTPWAQASGLVKVPLPHHCNCVVAVKYINPFLHQTNASKAPTM